MNKYDSNPLNPMVDQVKQFLDQKQVPQDQVIPFLMSLGYPGLAGAVAGRMRLERASEGVKAAQQGQNPAPPNVVQENAMAAQQMERQMSQGLGAVSAGRMENPRFAGGGIVAFEEGGVAGIDFTKMDVAQLRMLSNDPDRAVARAAYKEFLRRTGYRSPGEIVSDVGENIGQFVANTRMVGGAPDYMKDEQGRIRVPGRDSGRVTSTLTGGITPITPSAVPAAVPAPTAPAAPASFDLMAESARRGVDQTGTDYATPRPPVAAERKAPRKTADVLQAERNLAELQGTEMIPTEERYRRAGIEDMTAKQLQQLKERVDQLPADKKKDAYLALAQAGFAMAQAGSKPGATLLGSLGEAGMVGAKQLSVLNKEYREREENLFDKTNELNRYNQQRREGLIDRDVQFEREAKKDINKAKQDLAELQESARRFDITSGIQARQVEASEKKDPIADLKRSIIQKLQAGDEAGASRELQILEQVTKLDRNYLVAELQAQARMMQNPLMGMGGVGGFGLSASAIDAELARRGQ